MDENILDQSILDILFDEHNPQELSVDDILQELNSMPKVMTTEEMDEFIQKFFAEENAGEDSLSEKVCFEMKPFSLKK